jgi:hypothetical protein
MLQLAFAAVAFVPQPSAFRTPVEFFRFLVEQPALRIGTSAG